MLPSMKFEDLMLIRVSPTTIVIMRGDAVDEILDHATVAECDDKWRRYAVAICQQTT